MHEHITIPLLKKLLAEGFTTLIASAQEDNDLVYIPSKEPAKGHLMDDASITALSDQELLAIDDVVNNFSFYQEKGIEIEIDEGV
ncbi:MAG TPA: hypothetical protein VN040_24355 [Pseudosphingobacterium sp.]|nr:hypothetical protein [Pseudosphingobacterium sp.]